MKKHFSAENVSRKKSLMTSASVFFWPSGTRVSESQTRVVFTLNKRKTFI